jgi:hypothetical protein
MPRRAEQPEEEPAPAQRPKSIREKAGYAPPDHSIPLAPAPETDWPGVSERGRWAIAYAECGWRMFALIEGDKIPFKGLPFLTHGQLNATTNTQIIAGWWRKAHSMGKDPNIGLFPDKGWIVIDVDAPAHTREVIGELAKLLPKTAWCKTGREGGGYHFYFRLPEGADVVTGATDWCDVKGHDKGYVVAAPSIHPSGLLYEWGSTQQIALLPPELLKLLKPAKINEEHLIKIASGGYEPPETVPEGGRYSAIISYQASRYKLGLTEAEIWELVKSNLAPRFTEPLSEQDLRDRFDRGWKNIQERLGPPIQKAQPRIITPFSEEDLMSLSSVSMSPVKFIWRDWLPLGEIVIVEGMGGESKSTACLDWIARLSTGSDMPDGQMNEFGGPVSTLYISHEDDPGRVVRPRLEVIGGDADRIIITKHDFYMPSSAEWLQDALSSMISRDLDPKLVFIDPLFGHVDEKINTGSDSEMRRLVMQPLKKIAERFNITILAVRHFNKNFQQGLSGRGSGSYGGITGAARSVISVCADPEDPIREHKLIGVHKANYSRIPKPMRFKVDDKRLYEPGFTEKDTFPYIVWKDRSNLSMEEAMEKLSIRKSASTEDAQAKDDMCITRLLWGAVDEATGRPSVEVIHEFIAETKRSDDMARKALARIGGRAEKVGFGKGSRTVWFVPRPGSILPASRVPPESTGSMGSMESLFGVEEGGEDGA